MYNFKILMHRLSFAVTVLLTVCLTRVRAEDCGQEELARCAKNLQALSSTSDLSVATKKEELDSLCPELYSGLICIRSYTRRCMSLSQRNHFHKLYSGTNQVIRDLCKEGKYQDEFLRHAPCLKLVRTDYEICAKRYQATMTEISKEMAIQNSQQQQTNQNNDELQNNDNHQQNHHNHQRTYNNDDNHQIKQNQTTDDDFIIGTVCCSFTEYLDCSERTALKTCGAETAKFTRGYLDKMSNSIIKTYCEDYIDAGKCSGTAISWSFNLFLIIFISHNLIKLLFFR